MLWAVSGPVADVGDVADGGSEPAGAGVPHWAQNRAPGTRLAPQPEHACSNGDPQVGQNRPPCGTLAPQLVQTIGRVVLPSLIPDRHRPASAGIGAGIGRHAPASAAQRVPVRARSPRAVIARPTARSFRSTAVCRCLIGRGSGSPTRVCHVEAYSDSVARHDVAALARPGPARPGRSGASRRDPAGPVRRDETRLTDMHPIGINRQSLSGPLQIKHQRLTALLRAGRGWRRPVSGATVGDPTPKKIRGGPDCGTYLF